MKNDNITIEDIIGAISCIEMDLEKERRGEILEFDLKKQLNDLGKKN